MPKAARLLSLMSVLDRQGIPDSLLLAQYKGGDDGEDDFEDDIHTLISFCLLGMSADGCEFDMHRLVQLSTKRWLELRRVRAMARHLRDSPKKLSAARV